MGGVAERTILFHRVIKAPVPVVWGAWMNAESPAEMVGAGRVFLPHQPHRPAGRGRMGLRHDRAGWHGLSRTTTATAR
jgi:uncharacterized protein YndB with AHSA1/START domain